MSKETEYDKAKRKFWERAYWFYREKKYAIAFTHEVESKAIEWADKRLQTWVNKFENNFKKEGEK